MRQRTTGRGGFTLLELTIAVSLVALVLANVLMVMSSSNDAYRVAASTSDLEFQARRTLDRIALAVMAANVDTITPPGGAPFHRTGIRFESSLGVQNGKVVWGPPEAIELDIVNGRVVWKENPGSPGERSVVWTNWVRGLFAGEEANGADDNGNGLFDEEGLTFEIDGDQVVIRLSLEREGPDGTRITHSAWTRVTCRN